MPSPVLLPAPESYLPSIAGGILITSLKPIPLSGSRSLEVAGLILYNRGSFQLPCDWQIAAILSRRGSRSTEYAYMRGRPPKGFNLTTEFRVDKVLAGTVKKGHQHRH